MPKVTVIIPVYNVQEYLERSVASLMTQTLDDIEYIFVNDASTDCSANVLNACLSQYPERKSQVKVLCQPKNMGPSAARNAALRIASGDYIAFCDGDDWLESNAYEFLYKRACATSSEIVFCGFWAHTTSGNIPMSVMLDERDKIYFLKKYISLSWTTLWRYYSKKGAILEV